LDLHSSTSQVSWIWTLHLGLHTCYACLDTFMLVPTGFGGLVGHPHLPHTFTPSYCSCPQVPTQVGGFMPFIAPLPLPCRFLVPKQFLPMPQVGWTPTAPFSASWNWTCYYNSEPALNLLQILFRPQFTFAPWWHPPSWKDGYPLDTPLYYLVLWPFWILLEHVARAVFWAWVYAFLDLIWICNYVLKCLLRSYC